MCLILEITRNEDSLILLIDDCSIPDFKLPLSMLVETQSISCSGARGTESKGGFLSVQGRGEAVAKRFPVPEVLAPASVGMRAEGLPVGSEVFCNLLGSSSKVPRNAGDGGPTGDVREALLEVRDPLWRSFGPGGAAVRKRRRDQAPADRRDVLQGREGVDVQQIRLRRSSVCARW